MTHSLGPSASRRPHPSETVAWHHDGYHHHLAPPYLYGPPTTTYDPHASYHGPPSSFESNGSHPQGPPISYMGPYPGAAGLYFAPPPHSWSVMAAPPLITDISPADVLCGRGGATNSHSGNRAFRSLVKEHQDEYLRAKKRDKPAVASVIVEDIRDKGGRFLRRFDTDHTGQVRWVDIGDDRAREKTCQALRENAPALRRRKLASSSSSTSEEEEQHPPRPVSTNEKHGGWHSPPRTPPDATHTSPRRATQRVASPLTGPLTTHCHNVGAQVQVLDMEAVGGPIEIRPSARLVRSTVTPIPLDHLSPTDRATYLQDFWPPCPPVYAKQPAASRMTWPGPS
jgi:hypothetical protein